LILIRLSEGAWNEGENDEGVKAEDTIVEEGDGIDGMYEAASKLNIGISGFIIGVAVGKYDFVFDRSDLSDGLGLEETC
jgi:hypothetical protein